ncbi:MAG: hypothetical protein WC792_06440 [Candidatus Micrarchaeia archaeon]|jgi:Holliday junction resolvase
MPNPHYTKGASAERSLSKLFREKGFRVVRAGGSGSDGESPDLLVLSTTRKFALECKAWKSDYLSLDKTKVLVMKEWENATGLPIYVAWKKLREDWAFLPLSALRETPAAFVANSQDAACAITFEELCKQAPRTQQETPAKP